MRVLLAEKAPEVCSIDATIGIHTVPHFLTSLGPIELIRQEKKRASVRTMSSGNKRKSAREMVEENRVAELLETSLREVQYTTYITKKGFHFVVRFGSSSHPNFPGYQGVRLHPRGATGGD